MPKPLYQELASLVQARQNCAKSGNKEWLERHSERAEQLVKQHMPSGSGWDLGTKIDLDASTPNKLVFHGEYHHMDDGGSYDGWTAHRITVRPDLASDFDLKISGRDRNQVKEVLHEWFDHALRTELPDAEIKQPCAG
jgi:hypothetical protein